ncbi:LOW QUALITY PROTEIN: cilia- and flagella-associated protein 300 [Plectropomus leopardus]|uniref:LOW QUALITY PROTEIN: cilia- and flagella-associated protein 300 n=1 Tax=Plectropomus leopardus TaxID=160734 RepID=UPI001C4A9476|nr:LOW QUALITY PROTEIN: cilia- and flagella-associated protein 300 [Plectropomus leopardus]
MADEKYAFEQTFYFSPLNSKTLSFLQDRDTLNLFMKWSMLGRISAQSYSFDQCFYPYSSEKFVQCFFRDPNVVSSLRKMDAGAWGPLEKPVVSVDVEQVPCTKVSMELFDPIYSCGILRPSGHVVKCFHDVYPDYDELRQMLQEEDSEHYYVVGREERGEFLFRLFKHLCFGGELCQYEDTIDPYINTTKQIYKDLISVQKDPETKKISVVSTVLKVSAYDESGLCYPSSREEEQTFAYLIVDPFKRHVTLFYHCHGVGNFSL